YSFSQIALASSNAFTYKDTNGVNAGEFGQDSIVYEIQAAYPHGGFSAPVTATITNIPPAPSGLSASVNSTGTNVVITWLPALGPVASYTIERGIYTPATGAYTYSTIDTVGPTVTSYTDVGAFTGGNANNNAYEVIANETDGMESDPDLSYLDFAPSPDASRLNITAQMIRNGDGRWQLMFSQIPTNIQAVAFYWYMYDYDFYDTLFKPGQPLSLVTDISVTNIVDGIYVFPDFMVTNWFPDNALGKVAMIQPIGSDGTYGILSRAGFMSYDSPIFVDARRHMKQNLLYELRAATVTKRNISFQESSLWDNPFFEAFGFFPSDTNYVESSIFHFSFMVKGYGSDLGYSPYLKMDNVWPISANYQLHQSLFDTNFSGPGFDWQPQSGYYNYNLNFQGPLTNNPAPPILGIGDPYWIPQSLAVSGGPTFDPATGAPIDAPYTISSDLPVDCDGVNLHFQTAKNNLFGLPFTTALVHNGNPITTLVPGSSIAISNLNSFYSQTADPILRFTNYYFAPVVTPGTALVGEAPWVEPFPLPAMDGFSNTNQTGIMITSVGTPTVIGGWARFAISNGSPSKFAYLGQYYTNKAFAAANGTVTTNTTGVLSPYGEFFPTQPGTAALITMPDIDTGQQGTGIVQVISLNVDANHDGTMDFAYNGPDFLSQSKPFRFWVNDNQDYSDDTGDGIPGKGAQGDGVMQVEVTVSSPQYGATVNEWAIHGRRDLVDFFPLCINIGSLFQSNVLSAGISPTDTNYQFVLSQADGVLRYTYTDLTPTNYMDFLRDTNESGRLANAQLITITNYGIAFYDGVALSSAFISGLIASNQNMILVEAAAPTTQPLVLT
ncbi:MAG TPA: hypothetical protein VNX46_11365, partial [Candidatus Acidoferrum sp.]|nr:hypothetical protein [Candidatus Acidoferrum sp.]